MTEVLLQKFGDTLFCALYAVLENFSSRMTEKSKALLQKTHFY
jgi:hypothetical protein